MALGPPPPLLCSGFLARSECGKTVANRCAGPRARRGPQMFKVLVCSHKRELAPWGGLTALTAEPASLPTGSVASRQLLPACNPLFALAPGGRRRPSVEPPVSVLWPWDNPSSGPHCFIRAAAARMISFFSSVRHNRSEAARTH